MVHSETMQGVSPRPASAEELLFADIFRQLRPRTRLDAVEVRYRRLANAASSVQWKDGRIQASLSDVFEHAPPNVQEALAWILLCKLFRKPAPAHFLNRYRRFLNRKEVVRTVEQIRRERGRKRILPPHGAHFDLIALFEDLNLRFFFGLMARPALGWSPNRSRTILGHYDAAHHTIVISRSLDGPAIPHFVVEYVMYHEMLHLRFPEERSGSRRCVHTESFRRAEREYPHFQAANDWIAANASKL
ncbi:MAG: M48 family peptidase [Bryobacterales bacterium]|nr:M48 family peptidase [Bryobacterales bacterium]